MGPEPAEVFAEVLAALGFCLLLVFGGLAVGFGRGVERFSSVAGGRRVARLAVFLLLGLFVELAGFVVVDKAAIAVAG
jgi:hypothetical protein